MNATKYEPARQEHRHETDLKSPTQFLTNMSMTKYGPAPLNTEARHLVNTLSAAAHRRHDDGKDHMSRTQNLRLINRDGIIAANVLQSAARRTLKNLIYIEIQPWCPNAPLHPVDRLKMKTFEDDMQCVTADYTYARPRFLVVAADGPYMWRCLVCRCVFFFPLSLSFFFSVCMSCMWLYVYARPRFLVVAADGPSHNHPQMHTHTHTHTSTYAHAHTHIHTHTHIHVCRPAVRAMYIHTIIHTYTPHTNTHIHTYPHAHTHTYTHTRMPTCSPRPQPYTHTHIHTYIHAHAFRTTRLCRRCGAYAYTHTHTHIHT